MDFINLDTPVSRCFKLILVHITRKKLKIVENQLRKKYHQSLQWLSWSARGWRKKRLIIKSEESKGKVGNIKMTDQKWSMLQAFATVFW